MIRIKSCLLHLATFALLAVLWTNSTFGQKTVPKNKGEAKPNIVFILADDLGYGDLGCYGQKEIKTPQIDRLAKQGMRFRNFYAGCTVCAPSRCVLMTGRHMGHAHIRGNAGIKQIERQSLRPEDITVAEVLKKAGYKTALCGKWGLGEVTKEKPENTGLPNRQGFDYFYGYQSQWHAHNYYPETLWENEKKVQLRNKTAEGSAGYGGETGAGYAEKRVDYAHDLIMQKSLKFIRDNKDKPFFLYVSVTIPHANNEGTRFSGNGQEVPDFGQYKDRKDWSDADKGQAAMITRLDTGVGQIMSLLKELNIDEKTIVMFTSDNGHHDEGGHDTEIFDPNGPLRGMKRSLYEGGIRVPMIVRWPGKVAPNSKTDHISYFGDFMATACRLANTSAPQKIDSISFYDTLVGQKDQQKQHSHLYWEFYEQGGRQAVRSGDWKAIREPMFTGKVQLFNLANDLGEAKDVASQHPEIVEKMTKLIETSHTPHENWKPRGKIPKNKAKPGDGKYRF